jgi:hypothetical protein
LLAYLALLGLWRWSRAYVLGDGVVAVVGIGRSRADVVVFVARGSACCFWGRWRRAHVVVAVGHWEQGRELEQRE